MAVDVSKIERVIGSTGLSVGTHLALESLLDVEPFDPEREAPPKIDMINYKYLMVNIFTVLRNLINSYETKDKFELLKDKKLYNVLSQEITNLGMVLSSFRHCKTILYFPDYTKAIRRFNQDKGKAGITVKYADFMLMNNFLEKDYNSKSSNIKNLVTRMDYKFPKEFEGDKLVFTNISMDLFNKGNIDLLESHTGKLKTKSLFYTKLHKVGENDMSSIPFLPIMMYIFGDSNIIAGVNVAVKKEVIQMSKTQNWTYKTTDEKARFYLYTSQAIKDWVLRFRSPF